MDAAFLGIETPSSHMHVGAVAILGPGPLVGRDGALDMHALRERVEAAILGDRRFRQRLARVRVAGHWAWIDDPQFNIDFHLRHTRLPAPGDIRQLKRLAGRIFSQRLDRDHPLWEFWLVEGTAGGGFAIIAKVHHCLIDGMAGAGLLYRLLTGAPAAQTRSSRAPGPIALATSEVRHRLGGLARGAADLRSALRTPRRSLAAAAHRLRVVASVVAEVARPASRTSINPRHIGPHRRFDWTSFPMDRVRVIRGALGGSVNDVVLAAVAGALRQYLARRGDRVDRLADVRALVPVSIRTGAHGTGNAISTMLARLPVGRPDRIERYREVCRTTRGLKSTGDQVSSAALLESIADVTSAAPLTAGLRLAALLRVYNVVVTNVPGPPGPLALMGSPLEAFYPVAPLFETQSLGVAVFSYAGSLCFGISGDWHRVHDLHAFVIELECELAALELAARKAMTDSVAAASP